MVLQTCIHVKFIKQYNKSTTFEALQYLRLQSTVPGVRTLNGPHANFAVQIYLTLHASNKHKNTTNWFIVSKTIYRRLFRSYKAE